MKIFYGVTPPRSDYPDGKIGEISRKRADRFLHLGIDGLVLYDVQEESSRVSDPRPFPWSPTLPPLEWDRAYLAELGIPRIYYRGIYDVRTAMDFLSDYFYHCRSGDHRPVPVYFTLTPCGSLQTLNFMKWLGIEIPRWLENDLNHSDSILKESLKACRTMARQLYDFCSRKGLSFGFNVESVSIRKEEIDAASELVDFLNRGFKNGRA